MKQRSTSLHYIPKVPKLFMVTISGSAANVCVVPLASPLKHSGMSTTRKEDRPWLVTEAGTVQLTMMFVELTGVVVMATFSVCVSRENKK